jgi:hypothetical protein
MESAATISAFLTPMFYKVYEQVRIAEEKKKAAKEAKGKK